MIFNIDIDASLPNVVKQPQDDKIFFNTPDFSFSSTESVPTPTCSTETNGPEAVAPEDAGVGNEAFWMLRYDELPKAAECWSWEAFESHKFKEPSTAYITEAGSSIFDATLWTEEATLVAKNYKCSAVDAKVYISSLHALGLGRNSVFYEWVEENDTFQPRLLDARISRYTKEGLNGVQVMLMECGNCIRSLRKFVDDTYTRAPSPVRITLADAVTTLLETMEIQLSGTNAVYYSIIQLQTLFRPSHELLSYFERVVRRTSLAKNDEAVLSEVFEEIQSFGENSQPLQVVFLQLFRKLSNPWLEYVSGWVGLQPRSALSVVHHNSDKGFVKIEDREWIDDQGIEMRKLDHLLDHDRVPTFISSVDAQSIFEVGKSLRLLEEHQSGHPLVQAGLGLSVELPALKWAFSWTELKQLQAKASKYEQDLTSAIRRVSEPTCLTENTKSMDDFKDGMSKFDLFGRMQSHMEAQISASIQTMNCPPSDKALPDELGLLLHDFLASNSRSSQAKSILSIPLDIVPGLSLRPIITVQARAVNRACLKMLFESCNLKRHLRLQRDFQLLGNGVFSSRLSHALFDPDLESAEREQGIARSGGIMGLRLGVRETWPPASSELRLALMDVLAESYSAGCQSDRPHLTGHVREQASLPGDLSFSVRDMSEEEIDRCLHADSIEALDFLRLYYKPPAPLDAVISPIILYKYDQLFKLLLRVIRMQYVVSTLFRDATDRTSKWQTVDNTAQRFRIESQHFISAISVYFFDIGIEIAWRDFEHKLDQMEKHLNSNEAANLEHSDSVSQLRDCHEHVLDRIMSALLLRKRQQPVLKLLEEMFNLILRFAKYSRQRALGLQDVQVDTDTVYGLYMSFRKKLGVFLTVCKGMGEKKGYADKKSTDLSMNRGIFSSDEVVEENIIVQLVLRLEMSDYYSEVATM